MRLFVAVWPPPRVVAELSALRRSPTAGVRWVNEWHVTLRFLGAVETDDARRAFGRIEPPGGVEVTIGPLSKRFGRRVLQLPATGLDELAASVDRATGSIGEPVRPFSGHLTLARARGRSGDVRAAGRVTFSARWPVEEITLVSSTVSHQGPAYGVLERMPVPPRSG